MREQILSEIRRLAESRGGEAPGKRLLETQTGITESKWRGVFWSKWSDALADAGFAGNVFQRRLDTQEVLSRIVEASRHYNRIPTYAELSMYGRTRTGFPNNRTVQHHFSTKARLVAALRQRVALDGSLADVALMLPPEEEQSSQGTEIRATRVLEGAVYLIRMGDHYKIGRSDDVERRFKEIKVALPQTSTIEHTINTDDPSGIEAYWHNRFKGRRANGEWFKLTREEVLAFKRRRYQ